MPIEVHCDHCGADLRVKDEMGGKRAKCPKCSGVIRVPGPGQSSKSGLGKADRWHMKTEEGETYGPVPKASLDQWVREGRLDATCQVLRDGWEQWKWAEDVYPELASGAAPSPEPVKSPFPAFEPRPNAGAEANPYASPSPGPGISIRQEESDAISPGIRRAMAQTRPWVLFLAIMGFVGGGLNVCLGLLFFIVAAGANPAATAGGMFLGFMCLVVGLVTIGIAYLMLAYAQRIAAFLRRSEVHRLEAALVAQKTYWQTLGVVALVMIGLQVVFMLFAVLGVALG